MRNEQTGTFDSLWTVLDSIPEDVIAVTVYVLGALIILACWYGIARRLPSPVGGISWLILFAILATPTISEGPNSAIAPAFLGMVFGVLTKDSSLIWSNLALMSFVLGICLVLRFLWSKYQLNQTEHGSHNDKPHHSDKHNTSSPL